MSAVKLAVGVAVGLVAAGATARTVDSLTDGKQHGVHTALAMLAPAAALYVFTDAKEEGTYGRGALYGLAVGGLLTAAFVSTFSFGPPGSAPGFFGESKKRNDALRAAARKL